MFFLCLIFNLQNPTVLFITYDKNIQAPTKKESIFIVMQILELRCLQRHSALKISDRKKQCICARDCKRCRRKKPCPSYFSQPGRYENMTFMRLPRRAWKWYMQCLENHPWKTQLISTGLSDPIHAVVLIELTFTLYSCLMIFQYKIINP